MTEAKWLVLVGLLGFLVEPKFVQILLTVAGLPLGLAPRGTGPARGNSSHRMNRTTEQPLPRRNAMAETSTLAQGSGEQGAAGQAQDKAKEVASQAQDRAREAAGEARGRLRDQVDTRSTDLGERVGSSAGEARSVADELRKQGKDTPARYVEQGGRSGGAARRLSPAERRRHDPARRRGLPGGAIRGRWRPAAFCSASPPRGC